MRIAVCSGKGGTGKTTIATNLALTAVRAGRSVAYLDCDVEQPNGALFLKPTGITTRPVATSLPSVDLDKCNACGECGRICQFSAIVALNTKPLIFEELCHSCGGCHLACPTGAITEIQRPVGQLEVGEAYGIHCLAGRLDVGQPISPPIIAAVKAAGPDVDLQIADAPPGTSCPAIESVKGADFVLLATEPTPFGLNDLKLAVGMIRALGLPIAVAINRADAGDDETLKYCKSEGIDVFAEIPDDRRIAEAYSRGELACEAVPEVRSLFEQLLARIDAALDARSTRA